jgi:hypothetical protein
VSKSSSSYRVFNSVEFRQIREVETSSKAPTRWRRGGRYGFHFVAVLGSPTFRQRVVHFSPTRLGPVPPTNGVGLKGAGGSTNPDEISALVSEVNEEPSESRKSSRRGAFEAVSITLTLCEQYPLIHETVILFPSDTSIATLYYGEGIHLARPHCITKRGLRASSMERESEPIHHRDEEAS